MRLLQLNISHENWIFSRHRSWVLLNWTSSTLEDNIKHGSKGFPRSLLIAKLIRNDRWSGESIRNHLWKHLHSFHFPTEFPPPPFFSSPVFEFSFTHENNQSYINLFLSDDLWSFSSFLFFRQTEAAVSFVLSKRLNKIYEIKFIYLSFRKKICLVNRCEKYPRKISEQYFSRCLQNFFFIYFSLASLDTGYGQ